MFLSCNILYCIHVADYCLEYHKIRFKNWVSRDVIFIWNKSIFKHCNQLVGSCRKRVLNYSTMILCLSTFRYTWNKKNRFLFLMSHLKWQKSNKLNVISRDRPKNVIKWLKIWLNDFFFFNGCLNKASKFVYWCSVKRAEANKRYHLRNNQGWKCCISSVSIRRIWMASIDWYSWAMSFICFVSHNVFHQEQIY